MSVVRRHKIHEISKRILFQIFAYSLFGATGKILLYFVGLKYTSATISCALSNALPAFTFILVFPFGLEKVGIRSRPGQAKLIGTGVCIGGAMLLSFYHGREIVMGKSKIIWTYAENIEKIHTVPTLLRIRAGEIPSLTLFSFSAVIFVGRFGSSFKYVKVGHSFDTSTALMSLMSALHCTCVALISDHRLVARAPVPTIRIVVDLYAVVIGSGLSFYLMTWVIHRGPLYVSVFSPLLLVLVAFAACWLQFCGIGAYSGIPQYPDPEYSSRV